MINEDLVSNCVRVFCVIVSLCALGDSDAMQKVAKESSGQQRSGNRLMSQYVLHERGDVASNEDRLINCLSPREQYDAIINSSHNLRSVTDSSSEDVGAHHHFAFRSSKLAAFPTIEQSESESLGSCIISNIGIDCEMQKDLNTLECSNPNAQNNKNSSGSDCKRKSLDKSPMVLDRLSRASEVTKNPDLDKELEMVLIGNALISEVLQRENSPCSPTAYEADNRALFGKLQNHSTLRIGSVIGQQEVSE